MLPVTGRRIGGSGRNCSTTPSRHRRPANRNHSREERGEALRRKRRRANAEQASRPASSIGGDPGTPAKGRSGCQRQRTEITPSQSGPWLFPDSSSRYLSQDELVGLSADQLWRARNEIYARNGYLFSSPKGIAYAKSLGRYYHGVDPDDDRVFSRMNAVEQANVTLIRSVEQR